VYFDSVTPDNEVLMIYPIDGVKSCSLVLMKRESSFILSERRSLIELLDMEKSIT
jgi:hypothetical protein